MRKVEGGNNEIRLKLIVTFASFRIVALFHDDF